MSDELIMPSTPPRVAPLPRPFMAPEVVSAFDHSINTWGTPSNLFRTMAHHPALAMTEVQYANSVIFDYGPYTYVPNPDTARGGTVLYPRAGFVDRVTKELVINLVSLLNRSRYSITHHTYIGYHTLAADLPVPDAAERRRRSEAMLLHLVDEDGVPTFEAPPGQDDPGPLYTELHLACLRLALAIREDPHAVSDEQIAGLRQLFSRHAPDAIAAHGLDRYPNTGTPEYRHAYTTSMLVEITWLITHFNGLLNTWFTVLRTTDESSLSEDGVEFVARYNRDVPASIRRRNNALLSRAP
ncbi:carboxymuconolactone decarboxylase family protein [Goodfellowiella coeruleoviolacea]|uniref:Uncharacterized protein n=1 Tax=Goodfellowiella coeruleoviolacea TaxID=334858 RepID=A0AAE3G8T5_9PSEU|nr:hypothetical protein [Goodfellowiella coeruleoviolacea]MCP2163383.1 hypothetical protein [Goodfellowiella coeruleoviolacea]